MTPQKKGGFWGGGENVGELRFRKKKNDDIQGVTGKVGKKWLYELHAPRKKKEF